MLFRKLWRTMGLYKSQFISMVIMIALGIGVFVGFNMEWVSIRENTGYLMRETGYADYRIVSESGFGEDDLKKITDIDGVREASRFLSVNVDVSERKGDTVTLAVTENEKVSGMYYISGDSYNPDSEDGVWLSDRYAAENDFSVGDAITLVYKGLKIEGTVRGLVKSGEYMICVPDSTQLMPDFSVHGFAYISPVLYENSMGIAYYPQIHVISDMERDAFTEAVDRALGTTAAILTKDESTAYAGASSETEEGQTMGSVLPVLFLLIAVLTMVTTMHRIAAKEKTQIGTLKALGFPDRRILMHYTSYALMIGIVGSIIGIGLGYGIAWMVMNPNGMMGTYMDLPQWKLMLPWFCAVITVGIIALLTLIGFLSVKKMLHGTAADALRPYTPKKMKPLLAERTRWFHRLSFGTRWNLRDVMRHKSRTAMSLIGIVGGMILMVGSLGMGDTMDAFLDLYYNGATNYASRIYISEDATDEQRTDLIERYEGDWSASVSVQLESTAYSLDVYSVEHDRVRFPAKDKGYTALGDDGAYICLRIAEKYKLKAGDTFTVSPYGTDDSYTLKVAGVVRSVSENIVISHTYADSLHLKYTPDSIYTDTQKGDIPLDTAVKSVQSKQNIIDSFDSFTELMDMMIMILIVGALILGVVVLYNLGIMSYTERYREMATLKVVGFRDRKIGKLLIGQNLWLSVVGILIGVPAGIGTLDYLLRALAGEYEMRLSISFPSCAVSVLLTLGMSLAVSFMVSRKNRKIDMVEALKGAE